MKCGVEHFGFLSVYLCPWFMILQPNLPDFPQFHKSNTTGINRISNGFYTWARPHLMWNMKFKILDDIPCTCSFIWGFWAHIPWLAPMPKYTKTGITQSSDGVYIWEGLIWCEICSWTLQITFCKYIPMIWSIWAQFS